MKMDLEKEKMVFEVLASIDPREMPVMGFDIEKNLKRFSKGKREFGKSWVPPWEIFKELEELLKKRADLEVIHEEIWDIAKRYKEEEDLTVVLADQLVKYRKAEVTLATKIKDLLVKTSRMKRENVFIDVMSIRDMNKILYGSTKEEVFNAVLNEIWRQLDTARTKGEEVKSILVELEKGCVVDEAKVPALMRGDEQCKLPEIDDFRSSLIGDLFEDECKEQILAVETVWENLLEEEMDLSGRLLIEAIATLLTGVEDWLEFDIDMELEKGEDRVYWSLEKRSLVIGEEAKFSSAKELAGVLVSELRLASMSEQGFNSVVPSLGIMLVDEKTSLGYEEALKLLFQRMVCEEQLSWDLALLEDYLSIGLAERGWNFRKIFEVLWRIRLVLKLKVGETLNGKIMEEAKAESYKVLLGIFSSMPNMEQYGDWPLFLSKNLAKLDGILEILKALQEKGDMFFAMENMKEWKINPNSKIISLLNYKLINRL